MEFCTAQNCLMSDTPSANSAFHLRAILKHSLQISGRYQSGQPTIECACITCMCRNRLYRLLLHPQMHRRDDTRTVPLITSTVNQTSHVTRARRWSLRLPPQPVGGRTCSARNAVESTPVFLHVEGHQRQVVRWNFELWNGIHAGRNPATNEAMTHRYMETASHVLIWTKNGCDLEPSFLYFTWQVS